MLRARASSNIITQFHQCLLRTITNHRFTSSTQLRHSSSSFAAKSNARAFFSMLRSPPPLSSPARTGAVRFFATKAPNFDGGFAKKVLDKQTAAVASTFSRYREAIGLQFDAFLWRNYPILLGAGAVVVCAVLWRFLFGITNIFVSLSECMAMYGGFLALSSAIIAFTWIETVGLIIILNWLVKVQSDSLKLNS